MNGEPKKRKQLNRNGWQVKLYRYVWGKEPSFKGFCPMYWSLWISVFLLPFVWAGRALEFLGGVFKDLLPEKKNKGYQPGNYGLNWLRAAIAECGSFEELKTRSPNDSDVIWASDPKNFQYYLKWLAKYEARHAKDEVKNQSREARSKFLAEKKEVIISKLRLLVKPALVLSAAGIAWFAYWLVLWLVSSLTADSVWNFITVALKGAGVALLVVFGGAFLFKGVANIKMKLDSIPAPETKPDKGPNIFFRILTGVGEFIYFLYDTVRLLYKQECPLIEWADETKPIEKIETIKETTES